MLDLLPPNFYLFAAMKSQLKGQHFISADEVKDEMTAALESILEDNFQQCILMAKCMVAQGYDV